jgi:NTE family protein
MLNPKNKPVGLALGGGGARGYVHIGVLKVLHEKNIHLDMIAGSSIGAVIGAMYAAKLDPKWIENKFREFIKSDVYKQMGLDRLMRTSQPNLSIFQTATSYVKKTILLNVANDRLGLLKHERLKKALEFLLPVRTFSELKIPFSCIALDLHSGKDIIFNQGNLIEAVMASSAIPGYITPVEKENMLLVDGGVSCPLPVRLLKRMGAKFTIAVEISIDKFESLISPNLLQVIGRAEQITTSRLGKARSLEADVVIEPDTQNIFWAEFDKINDLIRNGVTKADEVLSNKEIESKIKGIIGIRGRFDTFMKKILKEKRRYEQS